MGQPNPGRELYMIKSSVFHRGFPQFNPPTNEFLASNYRTHSSIKSKGPVPSQKIFQFVSPLTIFVFRKLWWVRSTSTWCSPPATGTCTATCEPAEDSGNQTLATSSGKSSPPSTRRTSRASCLGISSFASSSSPTSQGKAGFRILSSGTSNYDMMNAAALCL